MKIENLGLSLLCILFLLTACKKDDGNDIVEVELRDRAVQQEEDNAAILDYLNTHYYNSEELAGLTNPSISDIEITPLGADETEAPAGHTLLIAHVENHDVEFAETDYRFYILRLRQGGGVTSPSFADNIRLLYEGFLFDGDVFDGTQNPVDFDLTALIPGWRKVMPKFNTAESFVEVGDGTVDYINGGLGVMFLPSGLAYFSNATIGISAYTPIMFKFELLQSFENDHDNDGIPSYLEDLNGDGELTAFVDPDLEDDDTDDDSIPNYFDPDDDNDRVPTIDEDLDGDGDYDEHDDNGNGIPNYLDPEDK